MSNDQPGIFVLKDYSLQTLRLLQDKCIHLHTLRTTVHHQNSGLFTAKHGFLGEALLTIDAQFRAFRSLAKIVVEAGKITAEANNLMQSLGWVVKSSRG